MKKSLVLALFIFLFLPSLAFANGAGLPAFFAINGKLATPNPLQVYGITSQSFLIPQDFAPKNYIVDQSIAFTINTKPLQTVIQPDLFEKTTFVWDYGDGSEKAEGLENSHTYTKIGSYILTVTMNVYTDPDQPPTQFIDSFFINILPDKDYEALPQAIIEIDKQVIRDPLKRPFEKDFGNAIQFDASQSHVGGGKITAYLWNFGDGQTSTEKVVNHSYATNRYFNTVVLRVKDSNGFTSDAFVGLKNNPNEQKTSNVQKTTFPFVLAIGFFFILMLGIFIWLVYLG